MPIYQEKEKRKQPRSPKRKGCLSPWHSTGWVLRSMSEGRPLGKALCGFHLPPACPSPGDGRPKPAPVTPTHDATLSNPCAAKTCLPGSNMGDCAHSTSPLRNLPCHMPLPPPSTDSSQSGSGGTCGAYGAKESKKQCGLLPLNFWDCQVCNNLLGF